MSLDADLLGWFVCGNISDYLRGGPEQDRFFQGTRMFSPGTKVVLGLAHWGDGQAVDAIGLRRGSRKLVRCTIPFAVLENLRTAPVYAPKQWADLKERNAELFANRNDAKAYLARCIDAIEREKPAKLASAEKNGPWGPYSIDGYRTSKAKK